MRSVLFSTAIFSSLPVNEPTNTTSRAFWLMLMKPPAPLSLPPNRLTLTLPEASPSAIVEVELLVLVDHRVHVDAGAEIAATRRDSADKPRLHAQREQMQDAFLVGDRCHALRHPDAEVDDPVGGNSKAARRAMIFRSSIAPDTMLARGRRYSPA